MNDFKHNTEENYIEIIQRLVKSIVILLLLIVALIVINLMDLSQPKSVKPTGSELPHTEKVEQVQANDSSFAYPPDTLEIAKEKNADQILYGRELIMHTALYLGPKGKVSKMSNGMNCQNCHLEAGTKPYGNNYLAVSSTYPKFRERSGTMESIFKRVNDCFERSLNGTALDTTSKELQAIQSYIKWVGKNVNKDAKVRGSGIANLRYMNRAASPIKGKMIYGIKCSSCHGVKGEGQLNADGNSYLYPPLWGKNSYNIGAGLYRLSRFAGFVKFNMPQGASYNNILLSDEEAWDLAAFVNSQPRPKKNLNKDWPKKENKPIDHPFGPYSDHFSETQHKYGPFAPIAELRKKRK
jgi:thiosulfate dehydrogenase